MRRSPRAPAYPQRGYPQRGYPQRGYPQRGLNGLGDYVTATALGFAPSGFDIGLGAVTLLVIGAAFLLPVITKKR